MLLFCFPLSPHDYSYNPETEKGVWRCPSLAPPVPDTTTPHPDTTTPHPGHHHATNIIRYRSDS